MRYGYESITEFIFMEDKLEKADIIMIPGGSHKELALYAAKLYKEGYARLILPSGGKNSKLVNYESEFEFLKETLIENGVHEADILEESKASHTFENAQFSNMVINEANLQISKVILLCKNFHARRAFLTYRINFPMDIEIIVCPIIDGSGITKDNWIESDTYTTKVMGEVVKIGKYFEEHIEKIANERLR